MTATASGIVAWWTTTPLPGAIGILHLNGDVAPLLQTLTGRVPEVGATTLADLDSIDTGLVARPSERSAFLMPHGGPQIRRRLSEAVAASGAVFTDPGAVDPMDLWPEAETLVEACMLECLARSASPLATALLLEQPERHRQARREGWTPDDRDHERARCLEALISPPLIAIVGAPNVGKSSLVNRLADREVAITADVAGTTRDAVGARVELDGIACTIMDLPGQRTSDDPIEQQAIALAGRFLREASLVVAVVEPDHPDPPAFERAPDLVVTNKCDLDPTVTGHSISARSGEGIREFAGTLRRMLVPDEALEGEGRPWCFHPALFESDAERSESDD
jgi:small GTP-binding protein